METKHRPIRSFVRREGRLTSGQQRALDQLWPVYGLEYTAAPVDLDEVFGRRNPKVLEIGFGNGETLVEQARDYPAIDFIGIEVHRPGVGHCLQRLDEEELTNVRIWCHDAVDILRDSLTDDTLQQVSVFFPDPWPKKRHHKRRLLQGKFVDQLARVLCEDGVIHIATDWADYADFVRQTFEHHRSFRPAPVETALHRPRTKFEQRGLAKGHDVYDLIYSVVK